MTAAREEEYTDWGLPCCLADTGHGCIYRGYIDEDEFLKWRLEGGRERNEVEVRGILESVTTSSDPIVNSDIVTTATTTTTEENTEYNMYLIVIFKCCKYIQFWFYTINHRHHHQAAEIYLRWFIYIGLPCHALAYATVNFLTTTLSKHYSQPVSKYSSNFKKYNQLPVPWNKKSESLQPTHMLQARPAG